MYPLARMENFETIVQNSDKNASTKHVMAEYVCLNHSQTLLKFVKIAENTNLTDLS